MALGAAIFPQDLFSHGCKDWYLHEEAGAIYWNNDFGLEEEKGGVAEILENITEQGIQGYRDSSSSTVRNTKESDVNSSPEDCLRDVLFAREFAPMEASAITPGRRKKRRTKRCKNKEEVENQRMTHIAVERNRRKKMNEYLSVLRSLMPASYAQRGDQASVLGGAINFVKELEQLLQYLEAQKQMQRQPKAGFSSPFAGFFTFTHYSSPTHCNNSNESIAENQSAVANIEVIIVERHANIKVLSKRRPKQLLKMVGGFKNLHLTILHLNVTSIHQMILYSFSAKLEDDCQLTTVDEITNALYHMLARFQEEAML